MDEKISIQDILHVIGAVCIGSALAFLIGYMLTGIKPSLYISLASVILSQIIILIRMEVR